MVKITVTVAFNQARASIIANWIKI